MNCADGGKHIWHFFVRCGNEFRACKKCPHVEIRVGHEYMRRYIKVPWPSYPQVEIRP
jgi:hypothetical protein